jgi:Peptidase family S41
MLRHIIILIKLCYKVVFLSIILFFSTFRLSAQNCNCTDNLNWLFAAVENNYAGYFDKVNSNNKKSYISFKDSLINVSALLPELDYKCYSLLKAYIKKFDDPHLGLGFDVDNSREKVVSLFQKGFPERNVENNRIKQKKLDRRFLGVWKDISNTFELMFDEISSDSLIGYIISSKIPQWHKGQVKIELKKDHNRYFVRFYTRDHSLVLDTLKSIDDEIKVSFQAALLKENKKNRENENRFQFKKIGKDIGYFRLPSFLQQNRSFVDSILAEYKNNASVIRKFIIDIRNNTGGSSICYDPFLPYIYTDTVTIYGSATRKSEANIQSYISSVYDTTFPESYRNGFAYMAEQLKAVRDDFLRTDSISYSVRDTIFTSPEKVVFLINDRCFSAAEYFLIYAMQSKKVTLMGRETYGGINYVTVNSDLHLPCNFIKLNYPISRSNRVDQNPLSRGIKPNIYLYQPERKWLKIAENYLTDK